MEKTKRNESGRTIIETLGILAIIALLTVGGISAYSFLIRQQRRQETAKEVAQLVTSIRSAGLARHYEPAETIPVREAVKGPETVDNGTIMKLPDSEDSYAVVTTLNGGAFAVSLQMAKGTCATVLNAFAAQPASMFKVASDGTRLSAADLKRDNERFVQGTSSGKINADRGANEVGGVRMNVVLDDMTGDKKEEREEAKQRLAEMTSACEETGRARVIFDCPGGSSGYSHVYGVYCNQCPQGMLEDANGNCCSAYACGNLCACPSGTMCDTEKNACVLCATNGPAGQQGGNEQCQHVYSNAFNRHVCEGTTNTCVECVTDLDCHSAIGPQNPYGRDESGNYTHIYCRGHKCLECTVNYGETSGLPCQTLAKPLCDSGACKPCPAGKVYDPDLKQCICSSGISHPETGACVFCYDDQRGSLTDQGCGAGDYAGKPICTDAAGTNSFGVGGTNNPGTTCYECIIDSNCHAGEYCEQTTHTCKACGDGRIWDGTDCRLCQDNRSGEVTDNGCTGSSHLCEPVSTTGNGTGEYGNACRNCYNNNYGENQDVRDDGCTDENKLCEAGDAKYGMECYKCRDDHARAERDSGCAAGTPICLKSGTFNAEEVTYIYGTRCVKCVNDKDGYNTDTGCTEDKPMCNGSAGQSGTTCSACPAGQIWNDMLNSGCTVCYDSKTGATTDAGCGSGSWAGKPICVTPTKANNGKGTSGDRCAVCINDKTEGIDTGCTDKQPLCNGAQGEFGSACTTCPSGQVWNGKICSVCFDTATGNSTDNGCGSGSWAGKPICATPNKVNNGQGTAGNSCALCQNDKAEGTIDTGCSKEKPNCEADQGSFGTTCGNCPGPDKCIDAAGVAGTKGACIPVNSFDDIKRGSNGNCECLAAVRSQKVDDVQWLDYGAIGKDNERGYHCERLQTHRQRLYSIPVKFYCPRYMHVSDGMQADDFVAASNPSGIGTNSAARHDSSWRTHDNNIITPKVSSGTIQKGTAYLVIQDRWAGGVGMNSGNNQPAGGYFYFTQAKGTGDAGAVQKLTATASWNSGSSATHPIGGYACKVGAGSSSLPSKYHKHCSEYCDQIHKKSSSKSDGDFSLLFFKFDYTELVYTKGGTYANITWNRNRKEFVKIICR